MLPAMNKNSVWILYIGCALAILLTDGVIATGAWWLIAILVVVHFAEFVLKRDVMTRAGGSMGNHFVQTMIYGFLHWKPLEDAQNGDS
jgi:hypothetical protein